MKSLRFKITANHDRKISWSACSLPGIQHVLGSIGELLCMCCRVLAFVLLWEETCLFGDCCLLKCLCFCSIVGTVIPCGRTGSLCCTNGILDDDTSAAVCNCLGCCTICIDVCPCLWWIVFSNVTSARLRLIEASSSFSWSSWGMVVFIWVSEVVFSQGLVKSCLLSGRVGIVSTAG